MLYYSKVMEIKIDQIKNGGRINTYMVNLDKYREIIIWGACFSSDELGNNATSPGYAIEKLYNLLQSNGYAEKIIFFVDSNRTLWGGEQYGKDVKDPSEILDFPDALIIINSISQLAILQSMEDMHASNDCLIIPYYFYHGVIGHPYDNIYAKEHILEHKGEIKDLFYTKDEHTRRYLDIIFELRERAEDDLYTKEFYSGTGEKLDYFCDEELAPKEGVTFIDVGAFRGDSIEPVRKMYKNRLKKCIAFEPDQNSISGLKAYVNDNDLTELVDIYPYALGNENGIIQFKASGETSLITENGDIQIEQRRFDELSDIELIGDVMVKMDIEGAELNALKGMEKMIIKYQPYMAICLYHKEADLYDIPKYLHTLCPNYRFYFRGGWHLECWAVPGRHFKI